MTTTTTTVRGRARAGTMKPSHVVGGIGGLLFVATVVVQNAIRGLAAPSAGASTSTVMHFYATSRASTLVLGVLYPLGAAGLAAFIGSLCSRLLGSATRAAALAGFLGAGGIFATYTMMVGTDIALAGYVHRGHAAPDIVSALWVLHNTVFGVLLVSIAVALAGLSAAASAGGLVGPAWKAVGGIGALALGVAGAATPVLIDGSPILGLGLVGFLCWLAFVVTVAVTLLRQPHAGHAGNAPDLAAASL